jgi:putative ABC transport system permease protein
MNMLIKISWRNIWRNRQRSVIMILAITAGLWGGLFAASIAMGLIDQRFRTGIEQEFSHVQIHNPEFLRDNSPKYSIDNFREIFDQLDDEMQVKAFSGRTLVNGMIATANQTKGINILGIDPDKEPATTNLDKNVIEGNFLDETMRNPVLIGKRLAESMKAGIGSRVVLTFQDLDNELVSVACRVSGIFQTANTMFDESNIYLLQSDLNELLGSENLINQIAIVLEDYRESDPFVEALKPIYPDLTIRTWAEISPQLSLYYQMGMTMFLIILIIILMALAFGLLNTMLMSVFERIRELGMLMSIGMSKKRVFLMIVFETVFLTITGALVGMLTGFATIRVVSNKGINLASVGGDTLQDFGFDPVIYPQLDGSLIIYLTVLVILTALFTGIYPALKAIRLQPAEAVKPN